MTKYYKIKYSCGCEYEGHFHSASRCPSDHYSEIVELQIIYDGITGQLQPAGKNIYNDMANKPCANNKL